MKREVKSPKGAKINSPAPPRAEERQMAEAIKYMIEQMEKRFKNQVFNQLHVSTVEKFADAQVGNFAKVYLGLAKKARRSLLKQFPDDRLEAMSNRITGKVDKRNKDIFYKRAAARIGISREELEATEGLTSQINAYKLETSQWIKKMRDETLQNWTASTLRDMAEGKGLPEILKQFEGMVEKRKNHAQMVARTQISTFNSLTTKARAQNLGIEKAIWITAEDERVRGRAGGKYPNAKPSHWELHGKEFDLAKGAYINGEYLLPGMDYNCFPGSVQVNHSSLCQKFYRRWYTGELSEIVRDDGIILHATPNHPILTVKGFKAAGMINIGDDIICTRDECVNGIKLYAKDMIPTFEQIFSAFDLFGIKHSVAPARSGKFHGDTSDSDIDIVSMDSLLMGEINSSIRKKFAELNLTHADQMVMLSFFTCGGTLADFGESMYPSTASIVRSLDLFRSRFLIHLTPLELFGFTLGTWFDSSFEQALSDSSSVSPKVFSDCVFALSVLVHGLDVVDRKIDFFRTAPVTGWLEPKLLKLSGEGGGSIPTFLPAEMRVEPFNTRLAAWSTTDLSIFLGMCITSNLFLVIISQTHRQCQTADAIIK